MCNSEKVFVIEAIIASWSNVFGVIPSGQYGHCTYFINAVDQNAELSSWITLFCFVFNKFIKT